jgi:hypothetical protein
MDRVAVAIAGEAGGGDVEFAGVHVCFGEHFFAFGFIEGFNDDVAILKGPGDVIRGDFIS